MTKPTALGDVIRIIAQDHGEKALLDSNFTLAVFMDIAPNLKNEKELLRSFLLCNGAEKIIGAKATSYENQKACINSLVRELEEHHWLSINAARHICSEFYRGVTNKEWEFEEGELPNPKTTVNLDVYQSVTINKVDRNTKISVSVDVDGKIVSVPIPESVTNGQTLCFPEKGKVDQSTGRAGDLYVTIHIHEKRSLGGIVGVAIAAVALLVVLVAVGQNGSAKSENAGNLEANSHQSSHSNTVHMHTWEDASCTTARTCSLCGLTEGTAKGHSWKDATYEVPKTCTICGATEGEALSLEPQSISSFSISASYGKLWTRSNTSANGNVHTPNDAPACWSDWSRPGHSEGAITDNQGNQYSYGVHVDGDKSENYYYEIVLNGKYTMFSGVCACPAKNNAVSSKYVYDASYTKYFEVYGDGRLLYTSPTMRYDYAPQSFVVDVTNVQTLRIQYPATPGPNEIATLYDGMLS